MTFELEKKLIRAGGKSKIRKSLPLLPAQPLIGSKILTPVSIALIYFFIVWTPLGIPLDNLFSRRKDETLVLKMAKRIKGQDQDNCQCHLLWIRKRKFSRDQNTSGNVYFQIFWPFQKSWWSPCWPTHANIFS